MKTTLTSTKKFGDGDMDALQLIFGVRPRKVARNPHSVTLAGRIEAQNIARIFGPQSHITVTCT